MNALPVRGMKILHVGADPELLWLRTAVLRKFWQVQSIHFQDADRALQHRFYDLVLICHSVPPQAREDLKQLMAEGGFTRVVITLRQDFQEDRIMRSALGLEVSSDPDTLVMRLDRLLRKAG